MRSLTQLGMPATGVSSLAPSGPAISGPDEADDERAKSGDQGGGDTVSAGGPIRELCATTGWHRDHARKALRLARRATVVRHGARVRRSAASR